METPATEFYKKIGIDIKEGGAPLVVATLNYCDIMNNPFQFYCQEFEGKLAAISDIFVRLMHLYFPDNKDGKFKWAMGKIDQKIRIGRYSPSFLLEAGIRDGNFLTRQQFEDQWDQAFTKVPETKTTPHTEAERLQTRRYDFILFHSLLSHAYEQEKYEDLIKNPTDRYLKMYRPFYELSFLSEDRKLQKFMGSFSKIEADVFFIQEYPDLLVREIQKTNQYHLETDGVKDKLIIVKKTTFPTKKSVSSLLSPEQVKDLTWSKDPAILFVDNFIIINVHLSSKADKNKPQLENMKKSLLGLKKKHTNIHFVVGGDINSFLGDDGSFEVQFNFYPRTKEELTMVKKRTMSQGQFHKGNLVVAESKDKIISSLRIKRGSIRYITNEEPKKLSLIPSDQHPFDHLVVVAYLERP